MFRTYTPRHARRDKPVLARKFLAMFGPVIAGIMAALAATFSGITSAGASTQFVVHVQAQNRILTSQHLFTGETLHLGLDGYPVTVWHEEFNGGGTIAWVSPFLPKQYLGKTVVVTG